MSTIKSIPALQNELASNSDLQKQFKDDPVKAIQQFSAPIPDTWIYRIVVGSLGLAIIFVIIAVVIITAKGNTSDDHIPTILTAISSGAIGALAGLLAPSPANTSNSQ